MDYQTFSPHPDLSSLIKCYWTLEIPKASFYPRQRIVPDGCMEMAFILGDEIKRYTSENDYILQPRSCLIGQITEPFFIEPIGFVKTFAVRFYPYGLIPFVNVSIESLTNKETPIQNIFGNDLASALEEKIIKATDTEDRIQIMDEFLLNLLHKKSTVDQIVKSAIDTLMNSRGTVTISTMIGNDKNIRRKLERKFLKTVGLSPKKLGKMIRIQTALQLFLDQKSNNLTQIAYESDYFDQSHFIKDFKEFTGLSPKQFWKDEGMLLSTLFYKNT
ncbi:AraC family transcriptional regulator [Leptospira vanthielii]|uniref:AraC family transcriptional regulator n=1 Tax=Leptospira vanthielii TaxID=293085 RepID=A0ABY2NPU8_9LEPT|nr:helix-turn-helix domain-containing protein [Leptospira vanthielii]TGM58038.1 AraC family transcriptional regulator [Leptospira vanthielii]